MDLRILLLFDNPTDLRIFLKLLYMRDKKFHLLCQIVKIVHKGLSFLFYAGFELRNFSLKLNRA